MTSDAEFGQAAYEMTISPNAEGDYELTATGDSVAMGFRAIYSKTTNSAYVAGDYADVVTDGTADYLVRYFNDLDMDGVLDNTDTVVDPHGINAPSAVGKYLAVAMNANAVRSWEAQGYSQANGLSDQAGIVVVPFEIVPQDFDGIFAYEINDANANDLSDRVFTYDGTPLQDRLGLAIGNRALVLDTDYHVEFKGGVPENSADAGVYTVCVFGHGVYQDAYTELEVTVGQLNLATADFYADVYTTADQNIRRADAVEIDGNTAAAMVNRGDVAIDQASYTDTERHTWNQQDDGNYVSWQNNGANTAGAYNFTVYSTDTANVIGSRDISVNVVDNDLDAVYYGSELLERINGRTFFGDEWSYDAGAVTATEGGAPFTGKLDVTLTDAAGNVVNAPSAAGVYYLTVSSPVEKNFSFGHSERIAFTYFKGRVDTNTVEAIATIHGNNVEFGSTYDALVYDGLAVVPAITVKAGQTTLVEGSDYTVEYTTPEGKVVDEMVDAGTYTVTVVLSEGYVFADRGAQENSFNVVIAKRDLSNGLRLVGQLEDADGNPGYLYTGSAVQLQVEGDYLGTDGYNHSVVLDPSWYQITNMTFRAVGSERFVPVDAAVEPGIYRASFSFTDDCTNYTWNGQETNMIDPVFEFVIVSTASYDDVPSTAWYAEEVGKASELGYVRGMGNNLFFPDADMTRAQFAQVVYNMAGEPAVDENEWGTYPTKFADVDGSAWYAKAVSWANEAGIVNGTSETTFEPESTISREEIATMLYRYAGNGAEADASALDAFVDGGEVCDWAETAVAWAVENGYMQGKGANDLQPHATATRAEIAALSVRVQPEAL